MAILEAALLKLRPYVYHITAAANLPAIKRAGSIRCAAALLVDGGRRDLLQTRRRGQTELQVGPDLVAIRDQDPLVPGALDMTDGATLGEYVAYLNSLVYLWPGDEQRPMGGAKALAAVDRLDCLTGPRS
jgi:hypothetical protein